MRELLTTSNDPEGILRTVCKPVEDVNSEIISLAQDLIDYLLDHREDEVVPVSLAAPQLGSLVRVIAFYPNPAFKNRLAIQVLINPTLVKASKFGILNESCLGIPGKTFRVKRAKRVKVKGIGIDGRPKTIRGEGLLAQMLQHEIDHLDGVLIDKSGELVRR